jgi:hypothetical protein
MAKQNQEVVATSTAENQTAAPAAPAAKLDFAALEAKLRQALADYSVGNPFKVKNKLKGSEKSEVFGLCTMEDVKLYDKAICIPLRYTMLENFYAYGEKGDKAFRKDAISLIWFDGVRICSTFLISCTEGEFKKSIAADKNVIFEMEQKDVISGRSTRRAVFTEVAKLDGELLALVQECQQNDSLYDGGLIEEIASSNPEFYFPAAFEPTNLKKAYDSYEKLNDVGGKRKFLMSLGAALGFFSKEYVLSLLTKKQNFLMLE